MKKVLLYSITPEHVLNFLNGRKTAEIRKRDLPQWAKDKIDRGEVVQGYGYCTKGGKRLLYEKQPKHPYYMLSNSDGPNSGNGKVVFKFQVSGTTKYVDCSGCTNTENGYECENDFMYLLSVDPILRKATCLEADEIEEYGNGADLYAHHFTNITPIEPMALSDFKWKNNYCSQVLGIPCYGSLTKAPQSFQSAWVKGE